MAHAATVTGHPPGRGPAAASSRIERLLMEQGRKKAAPQDLFRKRTLAISPGENRKKIQQEPDVRSQGLRHRAATNLHSIKKEVDRDPKTDRPGLTIRKGSLLRTGQKERSPKINSTKQVETGPQGLTIKKENPLRTDPKGRSQKTSSIKVLKTGLQDLIIKKENLLRTDPKGRSQKTSSTRALKTGLQDLIIRKESLLRTDPKGHFQKINSTKVLKTDRKDLIIRKVANLSERTDPKGPSPKTGPTARHPKKNQEELSQSLRLSKRKCL
jgi:hypothetical protein